MNKKKSTKNTSKKESSTVKLERIPKSISLNQYKKKHWGELNRIKQEYTVLIGFALKELGLHRFIFETPIGLHFEMNYRGVKRDLDGEMMGIKFFIDALVEMGMIPDDHPQYVNEIKITPKVDPLKETTFDVTITENNS